MYAIGEGMLQDYSEAVKWYRKAAEQGFAPAQHSLGAMYANGQGVPQDPSEGLKWVSKAAEQGYLEAQLDLGMICDGAELFSGREMVWQGHWEGDARAQYNLGLAYAKGRGVLQDHAEAAKWYRKAADQGDADAQLSLGVMCATGDGVAEDFVQAHKWFNLAAVGFGTSQTEKRNRAVAGRNLVASRVTPEQIAEAQKLAREWKPK